MKLILDEQAIGEESEARAPMVVVVGIRYSLLVATDADSTNRPAALPLPEEYLWHVICHGESGHTFAASAEKGHFASLILGKEVVI